MEQRYPVLCFWKSHASLFKMSTKEIVQDLLQRLPENVTLRDVAQRLEFISAVREGEADADKGNVVPLEEIEREVASWIIK